MSRSRVGWFLGVAVILGWVLVVYPAYYVVHKPLGPANLQALANVIADLLVWLLLFVVAAALGSRLTRRIGYESLLERLVFSTGLGLCIVSLVTFGLLLVGLAFGWSFWILLIAGVLVLWRELRFLFAALRQIRILRPEGAWPTFLSLFVFAILIVTLVMTLLPPTEWDSWVYHLVGPERYLSAHRFTYDFDNHYLFFPSFTEMLFTAAMALKSDVVARLVHYGFLLLTLGAIGAFTTRHWQRRTGLLAVALFLSIPTAVLIATWSYVDLALTFYSFAALYAILNWLYAPRRSESEPQSNCQEAPGWLILAGVFSGAALSIKYTAAVTPLMLGAVLVWSLARGRLSPRRFFLGGATVFGVAILVAVPWYVRNGIVAGNPIYPLVWGGREWNEIDSRWFQVIGQPMTFMELLIVPWSLTILGTQGTAVFDSTYSPLFLMLVPLLLFVERRARGLGDLLLAVAVGYAFWIVAGAAAYGTFVLRGRQLLPVFASLSLLGAYSLEGLNVWNRPAVSIQRILKVLVALTLVLTLFGQTQLAVSMNPLSYMLGHQSRQDYLDQHVSQRFHQVVAYLNQNLTEEDRVLFIWELRSYGLHVPHEADTLLDNFSQRLALYGSPEGVAQGLREEGFTHLLVNDYVYQWIPSDYPITPEEVSAWETFRKRFLSEDTLVHAEESFLKLYRLPWPDEP